MGEKRAYLFVVLAACLWGCLGIYSRVLGPLGISPIQIVALRAWGAVLFLLLWALLFDRAALRIRWRHLPYFLGTGILSFVFFNICYFSAIERTSLAVAAILLYTAPVIVMVFSILLFQEKFTGRKGLALLMTLAGCCLVALAGGSAGGHLNGTGLLIGLGAGWGYALYSIFGRYALRYYSPLTVTLWTFIVAAPAMIPLAGLSGTLTRVAEAGAWPWVTALALLGTVVPFALYTLGLQGMESGRAALTACVEPVVAALVGVFIFQEMLGMGRVLGIILVLLAVMMLAMDKAETDTLIEGALKT